MYVTAPVGAFAAGTTLSIEPVKNGLLESVVSAVKGLFGAESDTTMSTLLDNIQAAASEDEQTTGAVAFDITFTDADGNEVQPDSEYPVDVRFEVASDSELATGGEQLQVFHMEDAQSAAIPVGEPTEINLSTQTQTVAVSADSFSIWVIGSTTNKPTATYEYYVGDELYGKQIVKNGETLNQPETPAASNAGQIFSGWYTAQDGGDLFEGFGSIAVDDGNKGTTVNLFAHFETKYYVFYQDPSDRVVATQEYANGARVDSSAVSYSVRADQALVGWSTDKNADHADANLSIDGANITLYPVVKSAHWITFNSNGGSPVDPMYVLSGENAGELPTPTRAGYTFGGWYTDTELATAFQGGALDGDITLYAKWNAGIVHYTVVYWQENADDNGYSYVEKADRTGETGADATYDGKTYTGFALNTAKTNAGVVTISGDGTTIKNVYYSRNTYTLSFQKFNGFWVLGIPIGDWETVYSHSGVKYGQSTKQWWDEANRTCPSYLWFIGKDSSTAYSEPPAMPNKNLTVYGEYNNAVSYIYYLEEGTNQQIHPMFQLNRKGWSFSKEDYIAIPGFTFKEKDGPRNVKGQYTGYLYYTRNSYNISFNTNGGPAVSAITGIPYQTPISNDMPQNYQVGVTTKTASGQTLYFAGWYDNEACAGDAYSFTGKTMPAGNLLLYAKWTTETFTVTFDANGGSAVATMEHVPYGTTLDKSETGTTRNGYTFGGWTLEDGKPFSFATQVTRHMALRAVWINGEGYSVTYDANGAYGSVTDSGVYAEGTQAQILSAAGLTAPDGKVFVGWTDASGNVYYPGGLITVPKDGMTLTAQWAERAPATKLVYNANGGSGSCAPVNLLNNETITLIGNPFTYDGHDFLGWSTDSNATQAEFNAGAEVGVDTLAPAVNGVNTLYAIWSVKTYTVSGTIDNKGTISGTGTFDYNGTTTVTFAPASGYYVTGVSVDHTALTGDDLTHAINNGVPFSGINQVHNVDVTTARLHYQITTSAENGKVSESADVNWGDDCTITYSADTGYHLSDILVDGESIGAEELENHPKSYIFNNVTAAHSFRVVFARDAAILEVTKQVTYDTGKSQAPNAGDTFAITVKFGTGNEAQTGTDYAENGSYTFSLKNGDAAQITNVPTGTAYTIAEGTQPDGYTLVSGTGNGTVTAANGQKQTVTVTNRYFKSVDTTISGEKIWNAGNDAPLPKSITVALMIGSKEIDSQEVTPKAQGKNAKANGGWKYTFTAPEYASEDGEAIDYSVIEKSMDYTGVLGVTSVDADFHVFGTHTTAEGDDYELLGKWTQSGVGQSQGNSGSQGNGVSDNSSYNIQNTWVPADDMGTGSFTVKKVDGQSEPITTGATFTLTDGENYTEDQTTGDNGLAEYEDLNPGTYTLTEKSAPAGYTKDSTSWTVTVTQDKDNSTLNEVQIEENKNLWDWFTGVQNGNYVNGVLTVTNTRVTAVTVKGDLTVTKTFTGLSDEQIAEAVKNISITVIAPNNVDVGTMALTKNDEGKWTAAFDDVIDQVGDYTVTESGAEVANYTLTASADNDGKVTIDQPGYVFDTNTTTYSDGAMALTNAYTLKTGEVRFQKTYDEKGIPGAVFTLYTGEDCTTQYGEAVYTSGSDGFVNMELPYGTYFMKETKTPNNGYAANNTVYKIEVGEEDGEPVATLSEGTAKTGFAKFFNIFAKGENNEYTKLPGNTIANYQKINWYVNLAGDVLDTKNSITGRNTAWFTASVGNAAGEGMEMYAGALDQYATTDDTIRAEFDGEGKTATLTSGTFPTDSEVFANIVSLWDKYPKDSRVQHTVEGYPVTKEDLEKAGSYDPCDYYDVQWYVLKNQSDGWHVDGVLSRKTADLTVTKTFSGVEKLPDKFQITVADQGKTYTLGLAESEDIQAPETSTATSYTWKLNVPTGSYTVTESNYAVDGYTMTATDGENSLTETDNTTYSQTATVSADEHATNSVTFDNTYTAKEYTINVNLHTRDFGEWNTVGDNYKTAATAQIADVTMETLSDKLTHADFTKLGFNPGATLYARQSRKSTSLNSPSYLGLNVGGYEYGLEGSNQRNNQGEANGPSTIAYLNDDASARITTLKNSMSAIKAALLASTDNTISLDYYFAQIIHLAADYNGATVPAVTPAKVSQIFTTGTNAALSFTAATTKDNYTLKGWTLNTSDYTLTGTDDEKYPVNKAVDLKVAGFAPKEKTNDTVKELWYTFQAQWNPDLTVTKTFTFMDNNSPVAAEPLIPQNFQITLTGEDGNVVQTLGLTEATGVQLPDKTSPEPVPTFMVTAAESDTQPGTVTYTWTVEGLSAGEYTIAESGYGVEDYGSPTAKLNGDLMDENFSAPLTLAEVSQTAILTNVYDRQYRDLTVTKTTNHTLPADFQIVVSGEGKTYTLGLVESGDIQAPGTSTATSYTWTLSVPTGDYTAAESNYAVSGYNVAVTATGAGQYDAASKTDSFEVAPADQAVAVNFNNSYTQNSTPYVPGGNGGNGDDGGNGGGNGGGGGNDGGGSVIIDNPTPLNPIPGTITDIPDGVVPQTDVPGTEIPDEDVPLALAPSTGDNILLWAVAAAVSGIGLIWFTIAGRKRRDDDAR